MSNKLAVAEHFYSIQGEGKYMGVPALFLRLSGCNLMCGGQGTQFDGQLHNGATWRCDTIDVWMKGIAVTIDELIQTFNTLSYTFHLKMGAHLVITGGEPLLQEQSLLDFLDTLKKEVPNLFVEIETNGTIVPTDHLDSMVNHYNVSPKLANSGNPLNIRNNEDAAHFYAYALDEHQSVSFKFVVADYKDLKEALEWLPNPNDARLRDSVYLMPPCENITEYNAVAPIVAEMAKDTTLKFSSRLQINLWDKTTGV
jgi:6-pyruvoyltetrahydropterin 2'-reductase